MFVARLLTVHLSLAITPNFRWTRFLRNGFSITTAKPILLLSKTVRLLPLLKILLLLGTLIVAVVTVVVAVTVVMSPNSSGLSIVVVMIVE